MKVSMLRLGAGALVLTFASITLAQAPDGPPPEGGDGPPPGRRMAPGMMMGPGGGGVVFLLRAEQVQAALNLSEDQKEALQKWQEEQWGGRRGPGARQGGEGDGPRQRPGEGRPDGRRRPEGPPPRDADSGQRPPQGPPNAGQRGGRFREMTPEQREEMRKQFEEARAKRNAEIMEKLSEILDSKQLMRLKQIELQVQGVAALRRPEIQEHLKITDQQKQQLAEIDNSIRERMQAMRPREGERPSWEEMRKNMEKIQAEVQKESMAVLTTEQKAELAEMMGEPANIDPSTLWGGGNRRPRGEGEGGDRGGDRRGRGNRDGRGNN